jgi:putative membrane protein
MRKLRMLVLVPFLLGTACERRAERDVTTAADTLGIAETPEQITELLSPIRATGLVLVEQAQVAPQRSGREEVRQYGQIVASDHRALITTLDSLARAHGSSLQETPSARELAHAARMAHAGSETMTAPDYDLAFVRAQVETHRQLLDHMDHEVIPSATSAQLQGLLVEMRATADAHLMRARQLLGELLEQPVEPPPPGATQTAPRPLGTPQDTAPPGG